MTAGERRFYDFIQGRVGSFYEFLFRAVIHADNHNYHRLHGAFPEEAEACRRYHREPGYWKDLTSRIEETR